MQVRAVPTEMAARRARLFGIAIACIGAAMMIGIATAFPTPFLPVGLRHYACVQGNLVTSQFNYTPVSLVESPYGGNGTLHLTTHVESWGGLTGNGSVWGDFIIMNWSLYSVNRILMPGPGTNPSCPAYTAVSRLGIPSGGDVTEVGAPFIGPGNTTDAGLPQQVVIGGGVTRLWTSNLEYRYVTDNAGNLTTCGGAGVWRNFSSNDLRFEAGFSTTFNVKSFQESSATLFGPLTDRYSYRFPANFGTWAIDNLSAPGGPGGGWAFDYLGPCT